MTECLLYAVKTNFGVAAMAQGWGGVGVELRKEVIATEKGKVKEAKISLEKEWPFKP